jgi:hypothetical protein
MRRAKSSAFYMCFSAIIILSSMVIFFALNILNSYTAFFSTIGGCLVGAIAEYKRWFAGGEIVLDKQDVGKSAKSGGIVFLAQF